MLRHNEVLDLLKQGKTEKEIAQEKKVSINTVRYHKMVLVKNKLWQFLMRLYSLHVFRMNKVL